MTSRSLGAGREQSLLDDVARLSLEVLTAHGVAADVANAAANGISGRLSETFGGESVYVPMGRFWRLEQRYMSIYKAFRGDNIAQVAHDHGVSVSFAYRVIAEFRRREQDSRQGKLPI